MGKQVGSNKAPGEWIDIFDTGDSRYTGYALSDCGFICEYEPIEKPEKPTVTVPKNQYTVGDSITLSWNAAARNEFYWINVFKDDVLIVNQSMGTSLSYTLTNAQAGSYLVHVSANNSAGSSGISSCTFTVTAKSVFDLNGLLDGVENGDFTGFGTVDVYINNQLTASSVSDYYAELPVGTTYEIKNIHTAENRRYNGPSSGSLSGTIGTARVNVFLSFSTLHTFTFDPNGGTGNAYAIQTAIGDSFAFPACPFTREGYSFGGWLGYRYTDGKYFVPDVGWKTQAEMDSAGQTAQVYSGPLSLVMDTTWTAGVNGPCSFIMYAVWKPLTYTIAYDPNGGTGTPGNQAKTHGTALTLSTDTPTRASTSAGSYTVTLNANGGSVSTTSLTAARTTSYSFKNWNTVENGSGTSYNPGASYTANASATLYAQWNSSTATAAVTLPTPTRDGYNFLGWGTSSTATGGVTGSYTPTGNVTLYAIWEEPNTYTITYNANGGTGTPASQTKTHGTALTLSSTTPTRASTSAGSYTVTLDANGGSVSTSSLSAACTTSYSFKNWNTTVNGSGTSYAPGASYTANASAMLYAQWNSETATAAVNLPTPTRDGYNFLGWGTSSTATGGVTGSYTPAGNVTLYAVWDANSYAITYDANGGTGTPASQTKTHGTALTLSSTTPTRASTSAGSYTVTLDANGGNINTSSLSANRTTSYTFKSWNTAANGSGTSYAPGASYTANASATLYAQWNSSTATAAVNLPTPTRDGYSFLGWGTSSTATGGVTGSYTPTGNVTLYAVWTQNLPSSFTVSYNANGGTGAPESQTKHRGETLTLRSRIPTRDGYDFLGWATRADAMTAEYQPGDDYALDASVTLYAVWSLKPHTVSFNTNGGSTIAAQTVADGEKAVRPADPVKNNAVFVGWFTDSTLLAAFDFDTVIRADITLYAKWLEPDFVLPASLKEIGEEAFSGCVFTYVILPETTTTIGHLAFADCPDLRYIYIPEATTSIDRYAFADVTGLTIYGKAGSYAETFANARGFTFVAVG